MEALTSRQKMVLDCIQHSILRRGYPPTLREIGMYMGISSTNGVNDHLKALERKGYLVREEMKSRALRPTEAASLICAEESNKEAVTPHRLPLPTFNSSALRGQEELIKIMVLGRVAAGVPLFAEQEIVDMIYLPRSLFKNSEDAFGLRVRGDSMIEAGILNGDTIFVQRKVDAKRGEIVVALIGDEATVKYYYPEKDTICFRPANRHMNPIFVRTCDFQSAVLLGVVKAVFRQL
ncbi:transcriptional repressor LexA [Pajaroellobacter abortibovis]|uniref:LexA repressor n=1 Tax=Pajaroellobacter abortibovis TaxID=1882918 RepID=A0A1L6MWR7_9BACT|nr:repressor LexA [Pajaroellobacter abortibovis]